MDAENNGETRIGQYTADEIGRALVQQYFDVLDRFPDQAWRFYAKKGKYRTIYPDGTILNAKDWKEQSDVLLGPAPDGVKTVLVDSVESILCRSKNRMMVVASGPRFMQSFLLGRQPGKRRSYAIVASVTHFSTA